MNRLSLNKPANHNLVCPELIARAERELAAFFKTVTRLFGAQQAEIAAEDWLHELTEIDGLPDSTREWRFITAKVSARLARRVGALSLSSELQTA